jgi:hypothetical protein
MITILLELFKSSLRGVGCPPDPLQRRSFTSKVRSLMIKAFGFIGTLHRDLQFLQLQMRNAFNNVVSGGEGGQAKRTTDEPPTEASHSGWKLNIKFLLESHTHCTTSIDPIVAL